MSEQAFQDLYSEDYAHCYGCGRNNPHGLHLKSYWDGEESVCRHTPKAQYAGGFPGFVYGGADTLRHRYGNYGANTLRLMAKDASRSAASLALSVVSLPAAGEKVMPALANVFYSKLPVMIGMTPNW